MSYRILDDELSCCYARFEDSSFESPSRIKELCKQEYAILTKPLSII